VGLNPPRSRSDLPPSPLRGGGAGGGEVAAAGGGEVAPALLTFLLLSLLGAATLTLFGDRLTLADGVPPGPVTFALQACAWLLAGVALVTYRAARQGGQYLALGWLAGGVALWYLAVVLIAVPAYDRVWKQPLREAAAAVRGHDHDHPKAVIYCLHELGLNFHTGIPVVRQWREGAIPDLADLLASNEPIFVFLPPDRLGDLEGLPFHVWGQNPRFLWGANRPRPAGSAGGPAPARTPSRSIPARPVSHR
jgi:hypothetical protein